MAIYTVTRTSTALSTSNDLVTITAATGKPLRILVVDIKGMGTASAANEVLLSRSTGGTTAGGAITPIGASSDAAAAGFTVATTWSVQPTLGNTLYRFGVNANGGQDKFVALPGGEITVPSAGQVSLRSASGTSNVTVDLMIEEVVG